MGHLFPIVFKRIVDLTRDYYEPGQAEEVIKNIWLSVSRGDPNFKIGAALIDGVVVGHAVAEVTTADFRRMLWVSQCRADVPGAVDKLIQYADTWAKGLDIAIMRIEVQGNKPEAVWNRVYGKYGFKVISRIMEREIR